MSDARTMDRETVATHPPMSAAAPAQAPAAQAPASTAALSIQGLYKSYGRNQALAGVSFSLGRGERLAFLGPNGAGKTTLIRCLSGRTRPDQGEMRLFGQPLSRDVAREILGLVPQEIALYQDLTTRENLRAFGKLYGLSRRRLRERVDWALQWTGLEDRADELVAGFSGGMKRRVNLACGVMHSPRVLLLDEPTVGVDPQSRERIFSMLNDLIQSGCSILLTTHHLDEAEQQCDRVVIVDRGRLVADGTIDELITHSVGASRWVQLRIDPPLRTPLKSVGRTSSDAFGQPGDQVVSTRMDDVSSDLPRIMLQLCEQGYSIADIEVHAPSLHHVFLHLTGRQLRDG